MLSTQGVVRAPQEDDRLIDVSADVLQGASLALMLRMVAASGYRFTTPTPLTYQRVLALRGSQRGMTLRDIFGWNLPFESNTVTPSLLAAMDQAGVLLTHADHLRSAVRIASVDDDLFLHSAYPTTQDNAVFFGLDTYRFVRFIHHALRVTTALENAPIATRISKPLRILDIGCGSGVGGILAARQLAHAGAPLVVTMNDINPHALHYTLINADVADISVLTAPGDALTTVEGDFDLIISNPPYLEDAPERIYRHGGARLGRALSARIAAEALTRLAPGGRLLLYTGVAILDGNDPLRTELLPLLRASSCEWSYEEIDPDIFGEELEQPSYAHADRIAAIGLIAQRKRQVG